MTNTKTDLGSSENTKQEKYKNSSPGKIILKLQKINYKDKILEKSQRTKSLYLIIRT